MIIVALLIVWNSFLLWMTIGAIGGWLLPYFGVTMTFMEIGILCFLFTALLAILSASSIGDTFLKFPLSLRSPIGREQKRLEPLLKKLQGILQEKLDRTIPCQFFITEVAHPYIQTLGRKTIVLP